MAASQNLLFRSAIASDRQALPPIARRIFTDTFADRFEPSAFADFCERAYGLRGTMSSDLDDAAIAWCIAESSGAIIGYAKLRPWVAAGTSARAAIELQQIYVLSEWHGKGIAERLMRWSIDAARKAQAAELYLTVFDHNERAKRFYRRHGFADVGRCTFRMGDEEFEDRIWMKAL